MAHLGKSLSARYFAEWRIVFMTFARRHPFTSPLYATAAKRLSHVPTTPAFFSQCTVLMARMHANKHKRKRKNVRVKDSRNIGPVTSPCTLLMLLKI